MLLKKIDNTEKSILYFWGIKITYNKNNKRLNLYNRNRFYNNIISTLNDNNIKKGIIEDRFYKMVGYFPNLCSPKSLNEKLNWLKLYYTNPLQEKCCDKITFKDYATDVLGKEYIIPTIGIYKTIDEINFDLLPNKFVIKSNCGWGSLQVIIVKNKTKANWDKIKSQINSWLVPWNNYYYQSFEENYKNITPQIIIEEYLDELDKDLPDYKFLCYNGEPKNLFVVSSRFKKMKVDFFDMEWNHLPFKRKYSTSKKPPQKPENFDEMVEIARKLAKPFPFVRVDLYNINNKIYVGELTFAPGGGLEPFTPVEWDYKLGEMLELPNQKEI